MPQRISQVLMIIEEFRKLDPEMTMNIAATLLVIAEHPRISFADLMKRTGLSKSSVHRNVRLLSERYGTGLVNYGPDPLDRRNNIVTMTAQGDRFVRSCIHYLGAD